MGPLNMLYKMNKRIFLFFVIILYFKGVLSCDKHLTCFDCIRDPNICVWCASNSYTNETRCKPSGSDYSWCDSDLENPVSIAIPGPTNNESHITPKSYKISLRPGQTRDFSFTFKKREGFPVDLYFLFDASNTMALKRKRTAEQSKNIYDTMLKKTGDVFMGLGSFVDKNTLPYTLDVEANKSYSFRHHLKLGNSYEDFQASIQGIPIGENRDPPEATLEGIAQAIACKNETGWRADSRKILVVMTDAEFHSAGDGKVAGIFRPYDGGCYTENGVYTKELEMDYPSLSMINRLASDNSVIIIFAVVPRVRPLYIKLSDTIKGSRVISISDKNQISDVLTKIYEEIDSTMKLNIIAKAGRSKHFAIKINPDCTSDNKKDCTITAKNDDEKQFNGTIKLKNYEEYNNTEIDITMDGVNDKLTLKVDIINTCECQKNIELHSRYCNEEIRECGVCKCNNSKYGNKCQCTQNNLNNIYDEKECMSDDMKFPCNGKGLCSCGDCKCNPEYVGRYCQCLASDCPLYNGTACAGHGECQCNRKCKCHDDWSGDDCHCFKSEEACTASNKKVCNGRGFCDCGSCKCDPIPDWDKRLKQDKLCVIEPCSGCNNLQCKSLTECALCLLNSKQSCPCPKNTQSTLLDKLPAERDPNSNLCVNVRVDVGCHTNFTYAYDDENYTVRLVLQKEKNCAESYYVYGGIVLGTLLLVGFLTLVAWKLITDYRDKQEYEKFVKDNKSEVSPCENPLYQPAFTTFRNPAFRKRSVHQ